MANLVSQINSILKEIWSSVVEMKFIGVIDFEMGLSLGMKNGKWKDQEGLISATLSEICRFIRSKESSARNPAKRDVLKNFNKLMIETEEGFIIISKIENTKCGLISFIGKEGNLGLLLSRMKLASKDLLKLFSQN
jgi:hypothetical protein